MRAKSDTEMAIWKEVMEHDLAELNQKIRTQNFPAVGMPATQNK